MVQAVDKETGIVGGRLSAHFAAVDARGLRQSILSRLDTNARVLAERTLSDFDTAARAMNTTERAFNARAIRDGGGLTQHLRDASGLQALRAFNTAVERVEDVPHGDTLVRKMRKASVAFGR